MINSKVAMEKHAGVKRSPFVAFIMDLLDGADDLEADTGGEPRSIPDAGMYEIGFACGAEYAARNPCELRRSRLAALRLRVGVHWHTFFSAVPSAMSQLWEVLCPDSSDDNAAAFFSRSLRCRLVNEVTAEEAHFLRGFADGALAMSRAARPTVTTCSSTDAKTTVLDLTQA
jgi:hypothetical protein